MIQVYGIFHTKTKEFSKQEQKIEFSKEKNLLETIIYIFCLKFIT